MKNRRNMTAITNSTTKKVCRKFFGLGCGQINKSAGKWQFIIVYITFDLGWGQINKSAGRLTTYYCLYSFDLGWGQINNPAGNRRLSQRRMTAITSSKMKQVCRKTNSSSKKYVFKNNSWLRVLTHLWLRQQMWHSNLLPNWLTN